MGAPVPPLPRGAAVTVPIDPAPAVSRSGIPYRPDGAVAGPPAIVAAIRDRRPGGRLLHLDRMLLHSPPLAEGWNALIGAIRGRLALAPRLRELAILAIGALNQAEYEWAQHEPEYLRAGGTPAQLAALRRPADAAGDVALFDEQERAALSLSVELTTRAAVSEETVRRVRAALPDAEVVELIGTVAAYNMVSRFVVATGLTLE